MEDSKKGSNLVSFPNRFAPRRFTEADIERRRELGLCFKCDENYRPGHRCKKKQLQVLILSEEGDGEELVPEMVANYPEGETTTKEENGSELISLSLNAIAKFTGGKTIKLLGSVMGREVLVLVDCGATHSFVRQEVVEELSLEVDSRVLFTVQVGDAREVKGQGVCRDVEISLKGLKIIHSLYPFKLGGSDIILGADWLESLGEVLVDWKKSTLKIDMGGEWYCLQGDASLHKEQMGLAS